MPELQHRLDPHATTRIHPRTHIFTPSIIPSIHMFLLLPIWSISSEEDICPGCLSCRAIGPCFSIQEIVCLCVCVFTCMCRCVPRVPRFSMQDVDLSINPCRCLCRFWLFSQLHSNTCTHTHACMCPHTRVWPAYWSAHAVVPVALITFYYLLLFLCAGGRSRHMIPAS